MESDGPTGEECTAIGGATGEKDMAAASPSEVVVDVREVKQGDYVRVTLRFDKNTHTKRINIDTNKHYWSHYERCDTDMFQEQ